MISLRQMRSVVAVAEEGSFTRAAARENATQSGISQHVAAVEDVLGIRLFERTSDGVLLTPAGNRYYQKVLAVLRGAEEAIIDARNRRDTLSGVVHAGIMPVLARAALAPALDHMACHHPDVSIHIIEGYSGALTDSVKAEELDFAIVPAFGGAVGLNVRHLAQDREMIVGGVQSGVVHGKPARLQDLAPLKLVTPSSINIRKTRIEEYLATHSIRVERIMELDAMLGTLDFVARSDWVTILPGVICAPDRDGSVRRIAPLDQPPLFLEFVQIEPARRPLSAQAQVFLEELKKEVAKLVAR
ncbi:DNA-binding transcriptional LysR family regulator [Labrenzia sp. EL_208]|uniref:Cyn operon transcriptional activator n=1 Tax=Roseibium album TaxID=311410 RepID=A0A0M6ZIX2_9HYPH|nr:LysR family transcriptional regulator [Roseibium album]MBG6159975.1 DNA-binding transcriptional LysR family regulator [Labrenzia sp. EL_162]MBG6166007.1 DNA-binding transcriptional LysR family regulator [Labrenzia sp. EL_195]MBG6177980.1 DNA-binding transcriptional LysR family regulator [Labrenzia sp. EL_132]MBG6198507.1 DNA-binding transcriptional LysR family regulator [Labrenzia sp. EL_159]MBG6204891.1 DNA-binding transcriptional LysR family regulator [Labrenzia sp. EL_13]MBG6232603.1 DN